MKRITDKENHDVVSSTWPYGKIRDDSGANDGTPVNADVYQDHHQFFSRLMEKGYMTPNGLLDNGVNGFQLNDALYAQTLGASKILDHCLSDTASYIYKGDLYAAGGSAYLYGDGRIRSNGTDLILQYSYDDTIFITIGHQLYSLYQDMAIGVSNQTKTLLNGMTVYVLKERGAYGLKLISFTNIAGSTAKVISNWFVDTYIKPYKIDITSFITTNIYTYNHKVTLVYDSKREVCESFITFVMTAPNIGNLTNNSILSFSSTIIAPIINTYFDSALFIHKGFINCYSGAGIFHPFNFELKKENNIYTLYKHADANNYSSISGDLNINLKICIPKNF